MSVGRSLALPRVVSALMVAGAIWQGLCGILCEFKVCPSDILAAKTTVSTVASCCQPEAATQRQETSDKRCCKRMAEIRAESHTEALTPAPAAAPVLWDPVVGPASFWVCPTVGPALPKDAAKWFDDPSPPGVEPGVLSARGPPV